MCSCSDDNDNDNDSADNGNGNNSSAGGGGDSGGGGSGDSSVVVSGLIEVHCYDGSLAVRCCRGGWCCGVTTNIFFSCNFDLFGINKHMD